MQYNLLSEYVLMPYVETGIVFLNIDLQTFKEQNKMSAHGPWLFCGHMLVTS